MGTSLMGGHVIQTKPAYVNRRHGGCRERIALSILDGSLVRGARRSLQALLAGRDLVIAIVRETLRTVRSACFRHVPLGSLHIKRIVATGIGYIPPFHDPRACSPRRNFRRFRCRLHQERLRNESVAPACLRYEASSPSPELS